MMIFDVYYDILRYQYYLGAIPFGLLMNHNSNCKFSMIYCVMMTIMLWNDIYIKFISFSSTNDCFLWWWCHLITYFLSFIIKKWKMISWNIFNDSIPVNAHCCVWYTHHHQGALIIKVKVNVHHQLKRCSF